LINVVEAVFGKPVMAFSGSDAFYLAKAGGLSMFEILPNVK
jgi:hypothetical protein